MTEKQRNRLLEEMTGEVAALVLRNNYLQTQALSVAVSQAASLLEVHSRLIRRLERDGELNREIEFLPGVEEIADRLAAQGGLFAPELSVLIAYVKIRLFQRVLASTLPDEPFVVNELRTYFPSALRERYSGLMPAHRLAREIVGTVVANEMVNRCGITYAFRLGEGDRRGRTPILPVRISLRERCMAWAGRGKRSRRWTTRWARRSRYRCIWRRASSWSGVRDGCSGTVRGLSTSHATSGTSRAG